MSNIKKYVKIFMCCAVLFISVFLSSVYLPPPFLSASAKADDTVEILFTAVGDMSLASNYVKPYKGSFYELYDLNGPEYFCKNVKSIFDDSDCVIANLECALTDNQDPKIRKNQKYCYKGYTKYTDILTSAGIDMVNLANNHTFDYSQTGYDDTVEALVDAKIGYFGNGMVSLKKIKGVTIGFMGIVSAYNTKAIKPAIDTLKKSGADIIIASFHWGNMSETKANKYQVAAARLAIDYGADLVLGHHPHVLQGIEIYNGKYIVYSLGNFMFDGNIISDIENRTSIIFQQKFTFREKKIIDSSIELIPIFATSNMKKNNFQPMIAEGKDKDAILKKIKDRSPS